MRCLHNALTCLQVLECMLHAALWHSLLQYRARLQPEQRLVAWPRMLTADLGAELPVLCLEDVEDAEGADGAELAEEGPPQSCEHSLLSQWYSTFSCSPLESVSPGLALFLGLHNAEKLPCRKLDNLWHVICGVAPTLAAPLPPHVAPLV